MGKLTKKDIKEINRLRSLFPRKIAVGIERSRDGGFSAEIKTFPGCFTEADTFSELIEMVNDATRTYFEVPKKYISYVSNYIPPLKEAQRLDVFPVTARSRKSEIKLEISRCEKVSC